MKLADSIRLSVVIASCFALACARGPPLRPACRGRRSRPGTPAGRHQGPAAGDRGSDRHFWRPLPARQGVSEAGRRLREGGRRDRSRLANGRCPSSCRTRSALVTKIEALRREALLANPLLDFDKLLLVRRREDQMGLPQNWQGNCSLPTQRLRQPDCRPLAGPPGRQAHHALSARERRVRGRRGIALRCRQDALLDAQCQRPLADL